MMDVEAHATHFGMTNMRTNCITTCFACSSVHLVGGVFFFTPGDRHKQRRRGRRGRSRKTPSSCPGTRTPTEPIRVGLSTTWKSRPRGDGAGAAISRRR